MTEDWSTVNLQIVDHPYGEFLHLVEKPTRYTGREYGSRLKDWEAVRARVCLAFPDIYDIGTSHLGYRILYAILNDNPDTLAERCYSPWVDLRRELRARTLPLVSLESRRPLCDFDVVGFSLQFELCYTNILSMLELGRIPLRSLDRSNEDPLVIAGGPVATHAEPMAPFFDAVLIGDGEQACSEIALEWVRTKSSGMSRMERLAILARLPGLYVPSLCGCEIDEISSLLAVGGTKDLCPLPVKRRVLESLEQFPFPSSGPVGGPEAIFDRMSVEVARGCTEGCRFCQAGMIYRPVRERPPQQVLATIEASIAQSGQDEVSLTSLSTADISYVSPLIKTLVKRTAKERISLGVASLRAYGLSDDLLDELRKVRATGLTFAPEAGTQRMRDVINKNITDEQILSTAERVFAHGWHRMKLYFIMGLPTETDEDLQGIIDVGRKVVEIGRKHSRKRPEVTVSVSVHVPKPHTPFQWCAMDPLPEIRRKQALLRNWARGIRGVELKLHDPTASVLECILARGDRRLADVIQTAYESGCEFDSWDEQFRADLWDAALAKHSIPRELFLGTIPVIGRLPWDHIDVGLDPEFLPREYRKALANRVSPPCGKPVGLHFHHTNVVDANADSRKLVCYACGVECDMAQMREQRVSYLTELGATVPNVPVVAEPTVTATTSAPERLRPVRDIKSLARYRFRYAKLGAAVLLGHGDLIRELPRALRRAGLRLNYSQGFHPKPDLSFAPALSLGVASLDEYIDVSLIDPPPVVQALERLAAEKPGGLWFRDARVLGADDKGLAKLIHAARYAVLLSEDWVNTNGGVQALDERVSSFMAQSCAMIQRHKGNAVWEIDARHYVTRLERAEESFREKLSPHIDVSNTIALDLVVSIGQDGSVKPREVLQAAFPSAELGHRSIRMALLDKEGTPIFDAMASEPREPDALEVAVA
jgi:radical SAM family uncharacterized protein/radical SAM-linked protein